MIIINKLKEFTTLMNLVKSVVSETDITFSPEKMSLKAIHCSNSNLLLIEVKKEFFNNYEIDKEVTYTICIDDLLKILRLCKDGVEMDVDMDFLKFNSGKNKFKLAYFNGVKDERDKPKFNQLVKLNIPGNKFYNILTDCFQIDEIGKFVIEDESFFVGSDNHKIKSNIHFEEFTFITKENIFAMYDLKLLLLSSPLASLFKNLKVEFDNNIPLVITGENDLIKCEFILAGRVE